MISQSHVAMTFKNEVLLGVDSRPDARVAAPNDISEADKVILGREDRINLITLFDLVVIKLLKVLAHAHRSNSIARIETIQ